MKYAETGFNLEVDLSLGRIEKVASDPRDTELYLGGQGIAAKILFERVAVSTGVATKTVKEIRIDIEKCTGCRACEMACSAFHAKPRYSSINPARSRIRVVVDEINDEYVPVRAGNFTRTECDGRRVLAQVAAGDSHRYLSDSPLPSGGAPPGA